MAGKDSLGCFGSWTLSRFEVSQTTAQSYFEESKLFVVTSCHRPRPLH